MQRALNYEKYFNMTKEQLRASLARATQKEKSKMAEFFNEVLSDDEILNDKSFGYKSDENLNNNVLSDEILNDDEKIYMLDETPVFQRAKKYFQSLPKQEQDKIEAEVKAQMGLK